MRQIIKKSVSLLLALIMVISVFAIAPLTAYAANNYTINSTTSTDGYYNLISKKDWDIAPGITESEIVLNNDAGSRRQQLFVMEADLNNEYVKVINSYNGMVPQYGNYKTGVMSEQAAYAEANGYGNVVGAMNTCLSWYTGYPADRVGEPLGFIMLDAEVLFDPANCGYNYGKVGFPSVLVINKDFDENGEARPADIPKVEMPQLTSAADLDGWEDQVIPVSSGYIVKDGVNMQKSANHSDAAPRSVVGIKPDGTVVIMLNDGRQEPYSAGMSMYELAEVMLDLGCSYAVNCDGGGSSTYLSQRPGEDLKVVNSPSDGAERPTTTGILFITTAPADGEFYKAHISADNNYYTPNSSVQFNSLGTDMAGNETEVPADAKWQLADSSFGTIDNNGLFTSNGKEGDVTAQLVYNDKIVGEATITIVIPDIAFKQDTIVIGYGDTMKLPIEVTTNGGRNNVSYSKGDIVYTLSDNALGTIDGDMFTACDSSTGLTEGSISAVICGQTDKMITADIRFGKASEIVYDYEDGELLIDTEPEVAPAEGEPYGWFVRDTRANGYFAYRFFAKKNYTPIGMDIPAQLSLVNRETGMVKNGDYAMAIDIDWTNVTASCHGQMDVFVPESLDVTDATSVGFWMYVPADLVTSSMQIRAGFLKTDGSSAVVTKTITEMMGTNSGVKNGGWFYFSWDILDGYKTFEYFQINSHYTAGEGNYNYYQDTTFYVDDFTVDYSDATIDRDNPYFTSMTIADEYTSGVEVEGQTISSNTITLMAQASENTTKTNASGLDRNSVKLYVDGVLSTANVAMSAGGTITVSDLYLNDGVHTLVMEISDNQGNVGNIVRKLVVNTENSAVRLEVPTPEVDLLPTGSIYWLNIVADNLANVDSVTTTVNLDYVNDWELEGMEVAAGFKADYYINNHNDAVITFTRTGADIADTTVLAKLPVRIWMAKGWMDDSGIRANYISDNPSMQDKYYILTPHAMWYSDGTRDYRLVVSAEAGVVTYLDGSTETFSANETVIQTEMNRYYTNANRQNKWSFHICTAGEPQSKAATCKETGYENRTFCVGCACGTVDNLGTECDTHNGCGSVVDWGTVVPATDHNYTVIDGILKCECGKLFNGVHTDGKNYVDGVVIADGWVGESYYKDGVMLTGVNEIDGKYYNFGEDGICAGKYPMSAEWWTNDKGESFYFNNGVPTVEYALIAGAPTNFDKNGVAFQGEVEINGETCIFEKGVFVESTTADVALAGRIGPDAYFVFYNNGTLEICGSGTTYDFVSVGNTSLPNISWKNRPWGKNTDLSNGIKKVVIGKGITSIGSRLFTHCYNLSAVEFENGSVLTRLGQEAFHYTDITDIVLPDTVQTLEYSALGYCFKLVNVRMPELAKSINANTFWNHNANLKLNVVKDSTAEKFAINNGIKYETREAAFGPTDILPGEVALKTGTCGDNATWTLYESGKMIISGNGAMDNYISQSDTPWYAYAQQITSVKIGKSITVVGNNAFAHCYNLKYIEFEEGSILNTIGSHAFHYSKAQSVVIPDSVRRMEYSAFGYSSKLVAVQMPEALNHISGYAFWNNNANLVLNVVEGSKAETFAINNNIKYETRESVYGPADALPGEIVTSSGSCGENATWTLYESGKMVISGSGAMDNYASKSKTPWYDYAQKITSVKIGKDITIVGDSAFAHCYNLKYIEFEEGSVLNTIGLQAFHYSKVESVDIPDGVKTIKYSAFGYCSKLVSVKMPETAKSIAKLTFWNHNANLVLNVVEGTKSEEFAIDNDIKYETRESAYGPADAVPGEAVTATGSCGTNATWTLYESGKMVISGSGAMDNYASKSNRPWNEYAQQITSVKVGKDITTVGDNAFAHCYNIKYVVFETGSVLTTLGSHAFHYNDIDSVIIPDSVTTMGYSALGYCSRLVSVQMPANAKSINNFAFWNHNSKLVLNVVAGSKAETFAKNNDIQFVTR